MSVRLRRLFWQLVECFAVNNILTNASAIAFQLLVALLPLAALGLLLMGLTNSGGIWYDDRQSTVADRVTPSAFLAISEVVDRVLGSTNLIWVSLASALTVWEVSGSVRAVMGALNRIHGAEENRAIWHRFGLSFLLAAGVIALTVGAVTLVALGGPVFWPAALVMLWLTLAMLMRLAPAEALEGRWVTTGSLMVIVFWSAASLAYGAYVRYVVDFESAFGFVAAGLVLTGYLYASAIVFLVGAQVDELLRDGTTPAAKPRGRAGAA